jgi:hypothetical protein
MCGEKSKNEQRVEGFRVQLKHASLVSVLCIFYFLFTYDGVGSGFLLATSTEMRAQNFLHMWDFIGNKTS